MLNKAQQTFVDQYTRKLLVEWAVLFVQGAEPNLRIDDPNLFVQHALDKGWLKKNGTDLTAKGYGVASSFLKR